MLLIPPPGQLLGPGSYLSAACFAAFAAIEDPISGGAGWIGAGLLGLILFWLLMKHLPAKDAQIDAFVRGKDTHVEAITAKFVESINEARREAKVEREQARADQNEDRNLFLAELEKQRILRHEQAQHFTTSLVQLHTVLSELRLAVQQTGQQIGHQAGKVGAGA